MPPTPAATTAEKPADPAFVNYRQLAELLRDPAGKDKFLRRMVADKSILRLAPDSSFDPLVNVAILYDRTSWILPELLAAPSLLRMPNGESKSSKRALGLCGIHRYGLFNQLDVVAPVIDKDPSLLELVTNNGKTAIDLCSHKGMREHFTTVLTVYRAKLSAAPPAADLS